ncbi:MAG: hypothetical protein FD123_378 [Bacteroidetes bacterium]|nr:MAG: hypothetical protein FD123_378 [Bacteroidota bacterium]
MKKIFTLAAVAVSLASFAQTFSSPESVEYDGVNNRWIVGQNGANRIDIYSPASSTLTPFGTTITSGPHGIEVLGSVAYACDGGRIRGYDLSNGSEVFNVNLGATFLNGLTSDGGYFLFATDYSAKQIFRINTQTNAFNLMTSTTYSPNGIYYDGANNRCVFVNWGSNARVQAMSLADSTISNLYTTSTSNIDGITRDQAGYWYITTWGGNALRMFDPTFSAAPTSVMTGLSNPADIDINAAGDSIGIPNSGSANNVVFYTGITTGIKPVDFGMLPMTCTPNPATTQALVTLEQPVENAKLIVSDMAGRKMSEQVMNGKSLSVTRGALPDGFYYFSLYNAGGKLIANQKVAFIKGE